jgi:nucleoside phosphorylase
MTDNDYKTLEETILLFWDTEENFRKDITQQKLIPDFYKEVILIDSLQKMNDVMSNNYSAEQKFLFFVHLDHSNANKGLDSFKASKIKKEYPGLAYYCVSSTSRSLIYEGEKNNTIDVFSYDNLHTDVEARFVIQTKAEQKRIPEISKSPVVELLPDESHQFDYAILTALYQDEFEELKKIFDFPKDEVIKVKKKTFRVGYLKSDNNIKVIAAFLNETGPVEAAIVSTMMLELFKPKYLLMSGVCGGAKKYNFGDIIVAKKIFAFQKGKLSDHSSLLDLLEEDGTTSLILFDKDKNPVDPFLLYDSDNNHVPVAVENFELEQDSMINLDTSVEDELNIHLDEIREKINTHIKEDLRFNTKPPEIKIAIEPMASGTMVINKKGYFEEVIEAIHRKTAAVEMESYGLARACQLANNGFTIPIIFKSVMDHTYKKEDAPGGTNVKKFAAYTSALFMKYLFEYKII